jgi:hypothetical protein
MGGVSTILSPAQRGTIWRVRIAWPNGQVHYFGEFTSEKEATTWIADHALLLKPRPPDSELPPRVEKKPR